MGVRGRDRGPLLVSDEEMEAASTCALGSAKILLIGLRFLSCVLLLQNLKLANTSHGTLKPDIDDMRPDIV